MRELQVIADVLRECECHWIIEEIAKKDVGLSQMLDVLILPEDDWEPPTLK